MDPVQNYTKTLQDRDEWSNLERNVGMAERIGSGVLGGGLVVMAALVRTPLAVAGGLLGAALVVRGVTGTCAVYRHAGVSSATTAHKDHGLSVVPTPDEARIDDMLDDSFPASDPPSFSPSRASTT